MRTLRWLVVSLAFTAICFGEVAEKYRGDWLMVNGVLVIHVDADGTTTLRNSGAKAVMAVKDDGSFTWDLAEHAQSGKFLDGKLMLKNDQPSSPKWVEYIEFRRTDKDMASEMIEYALRQQNQVTAAFEKIRRSSMEKAILNNLRQLSAAADQFFLENGTTKVKLEQIVGPDKYIKSLTPVDGEDYSTLDLSQEVRPWKIVSASGITVTYDR